MVTKLYYTFMYTLTRKCQNWVISIIMFSVTWDEGFCVLLSQTPTSPYLTSMRKSDTRLLTLSSLNPTWLLSSSELILPQNSTAQFLVSCLDELVPGAVHTPHTSMWPPSHPPSISLSSKLLHVWLKRWCLNEEFDHCLPPINCWTKARYACLACVLPNVWVVGYVWSSETFPFFQMKY